MSLLDHPLGRLDRPGLPLANRNASTSTDTLLMRVGIPHRSGRLAFHACQRGYSAMVSAQAFWCRRTAAFRMPEASDLFDLDFALDSAGYTAMKLWKGRGRQPGMAGIFPWSYSQYLEVANLVGCSWYSAPDLCVEPDIATNQEEVDFRINATATLLEGCLRVLYEWQNQLARDCSPAVVANLARPPMPFIQGWAPADYERSLELTLQVWGRWRPWLASPVLLGIGSVCRRSLRHPDHGLEAVLTRLAKVWPSGPRAHLFGVKGTALGELQAMGWVASADSMAYDFGARIKARKKAMSNCIAHRCAEMDSWMSRALARCSPVTDEVMP